MPGYGERMLENIISNDEHMLRILKNHGDPAENLKRIEENFPKYKDEFNKCYKNHFMRKVI